MESALLGASPLALVAGSTLLIAIPTSLSADNSQKYRSQSLLSKIAAIDYIGVALLASSICLLLYGLSTQRITILPIILSVLLFPLFLYQETYASSDPIIPVTVLRSRGTLFTCLAALGFLMARWTVLFYIPVYAIRITSHPNKSWLRAGRCDTGCGAYSPSWLVLGIMSGHFRTFPNYDRAFGACRDRHESGVGRCVGGVCEWAACGCGA